MAQALKSFTYEDVELFCDKTLQTGTPVTLKLLLTEFPNDSIDVVAYFHQWRQHNLNQSLATSSQHSDDKPAIPPSITQILEEEIAKLQASQVKEQQSILAQQQDIEQFLIAKSQELQESLNSQSKFVDETHKQLEQQSQEFQNRLQQLTDDYNNEINTLKQNHQQSLITQQQEHQIAIETVINENEAQLANLTDQVELLTETNTLLKVQADEYQASQQQLRTLQSTINQLEEQLTKEKAEQAQHISTAKKQYQENLNALRDAHQQEIDELTTSHQNIKQDEDANEQLSTIQQENQNLEQQLADEKSKSAKLQTRLFNVSNDTTKAHEVKTELLASLEDANAKIITLEQQLSQTQTGLTQESDFNALEKAERMVTILRKENGKLANQLDHIKTNSVATIERLTGKSDQAITRIKELESQLDLEIQTNGFAKEERIKLKEQLELMRHNQASTFERLTKNAEQAKAKVESLEQQLAEMKR